MNSIRIVSALMRKDLRLHWRGILLTQLIVIVFVFWTFRLASRNVPRGEYAGAAALFNINFIAALLWTEWLVSREKTKGTIAWLRTLPIADAQLVIAKFAAYLLIVGFLWIASTLLLVPWYWTRAGLLSMVLGFCALAAFGTMSIGARWRFRQKVGQTLPFAVLILPVFLIAFANDRKTALVLQIGNWASTAAGKLVVSSLLLAFSGLCCAWTMRWVSRADTQKLLE